MKNFKIFNFLTIKIYKIMTFVNFFEYIKNWRVLCKRKNLIFLTLKSCNFYGQNHVFIFLLRASGIRWRPFYSAGKIELYQK